MVLITFVFLKSIHLEEGDWINIFSVVVNFFLALWIVNRLQKVQTRRRYLIELEVAEIISIRDEYRTMFDRLLNEEFAPKQIMPWFKNINHKIQDTMSLINQTNNKIDINFLSVYQLPLKKILDNDELSQQYTTRPKLKYSDLVWFDINNFRIKHDKLFNELIILVNNAD